MDYRFSLIPGDGIGPEVTEAVVEIIKALGVKIDWERVDAGAAVIDKYQTPLPPHVLQSIKKNRIALKGPITTPVGKGFSSVNVTLRKELNLYASLRPVKTLPGIQSAWKDVDIVVVRENTEGLYSGLEHMVSPGVAIAFKVLSKKASLRIARFAYEYAKNEGRRKVTVAHKASVVKLADNQFLEYVKQVSEDYPFIQTEFLKVDNIAMELAEAPEQFEVLLLDNLFGDIVSDIAAGLAGGLGLVPGANIGSNMAVFEAVHGSAPDIAGQGIANPIALLLSSALMLHHIGERKQSNRLYDAVCKVLDDGQMRTIDLGGHASTKDMQQAIIDAIPKNIHGGMA